MPTNQEQEEPCQTACASKGVPVEIRRARLGLAILNGPPQTPRGANPMPESPLVTTALSGPLATPLSGDAHRLIEASISQNTRKAYTAALDRLDRFLDGQPLTDEALANYLGLLHEYGHPSKRADHQPRPLSPPSLALIVQAVRFVERLQQRPSSVVGPLTERTLAGARREGKDRGRGQVAAITREQLAVMVRDAERKDTLAGLRDAALFRVMSDGLLRISEAVRIDGEHISEEAEGSGRLLLPSSKTDQEGKGALLYLKPNTLRAIRDCQARAGFMDGPLFRRMQKGDHIDRRRLTADGARLIIKAAARAAHIEGASGHSFRIGTAESLSQSGASLVDLQNAGRWKSPDMPAHYTRKQEAGKGAVARLLDDL